MDKCPWLDTHVTSTLHGAGLTQEGDRLQGTGGRHRAALTARESS